MRKIFLLIFLLSIQQTFALDRIGRLGLGMSNQLANDRTAISFKLQQTKSFAMGGLLNFDNDSNTGGYGAGLKVYQTFINEPQLNLYGSIMGAMLSSKAIQGDNSGFQFDFTIGSEFSFEGLNSLGFSFETGVSVQNVDNVVVSTVGYHFITAGIHFYL